MAKHESNMDMMKRVAAQQRHEERVEAMRSGVRLRPQTFRSGKEYRRKSKYKEW